MCKFRARLGERRVSARSRSEPVSKKPVVIWCLRKADLGIHWARAQAATDSQSAAMDARLREPSRKICCAR
jgi:hypothetical protein